MSETGTLSVHFERKVSDGDYGNESASCSVTADFGEDALTDGYAHELARQMRELCRDNVQAQLDRSPELNVRRAAETREAREARYTHERLLNAWRRAAEADRIAQADLAHARSALEVAVRRAEEAFGDAAAVRSVQARQSDVERAEGWAATARKQLMAAQEAAATAGVVLDAAAVVAGAAEDLPF